MCPKAASLVTKRYLGQGDERLHQSDAYIRQAPVPTVLPVRVLLLGLVGWHFLSDLNGLLQKLFLIRPEERAIVPMVRSRLGASMFKARNSGNVRNIAIELNLSRFVDIHKRVLALCQLVSETLMVWLDSKLVERSDEADCEGYTD